MPGPEQGSRAADVAQYRVRSCTVFTHLRLLCNAEENAGALTKEFQNKYSGQRIAI